MSIGLMLIGMFVLVLINVPVAVSLAVVAVAAIWIAQGPNMLPNVALVMFEGATNFPLLAVPLFIFAGGIMNASTISRRLINSPASNKLKFVHIGRTRCDISSALRVRSIFLKAHERLNPVHSPKVGYTYYKNFTCSHEECAQAEILKEGTTPAF